MRTTVLNCFCVKAAESAHYQHSLRFLSEDWGDCQNGMYVEVGKKALKNTILWNLHRDKAIRNRDEV